MPSKGQFEKRTDGFIYNFPPHPQIPSCPYIIPSLCELGFCGLLSFIFHFYFSFFAFWGSSNLSKGPERKYKQSLLFLFSFSEVPVLDETVSEDLSYPFAFHKKERLEEKRQCPPARTQGQSQISSFVSKSYQCPRLPKGGNQLRQMITSFLRLFQFIFPFPRSPSSHLSSHTTTYQAYNALLSSAKGQPNVPPQKNPPLSTPPWPSIREIISKPNLPHFSLPNIFLIHFSFRPPRTVVGSAADKAPAKECGGGV